MSRVHDMGGRFGDGAVVPEPQGIPAFAADWHRRALALTLAAGGLGLWNIDMSRRAREALAPRDYARFGYYEKWIAALADLLVETGALTEADMGGDGTEGPSPFRDRALKADRVAGVLARGAPADRPGRVPPRFTVGQRVRARRPAGNRLVEGGHTRLPVYASGATGHILRLHGHHVLPDSHAHGHGEAPEPLYSVAFPASELWVTPEGGTDEVMLDLWQSYLEPA